MILPAVMSLCKNERNRLPCTEHAGSTDKVSDLKFPVRISAEMSTDLIFSSVSPKISRNRIVAKIIKRPLRPTLFRIHYSLFILSRNVMQSELTALLNKPRKAKKDKVVPVLNQLSTTPGRRTEGGGIAPPFLSSALDKVNCHLHAPAALPPVKELSAPIAYEAGRAPELVWTLWRREKYLAPAGNRTPDADNIARHYTD
jgi:hypothetical protein